MRLRMHDKKKVTRTLTERYHKSSKKGKSIILNEFIAITKYNRCYASYLLKNHGRKVKINNNVIVIGDVNKRGKRPGGKRFYDYKVLLALRSIWYIMDNICGKRLAPVLSEIIDVLEKHKEIELSSEVKEKLKKISAATIDRLLKGERKKYNLKGRSNTKPGTLLKHQIPIRTFSEWDEKKPGFVEIDLVGHEGGNPSGDYAQTLDVTDVHTTWTETQAVKNKAQVWVSKAMEDIMDCFPFDILGIDSDNGSEFINANLFRFCQERKLTFTRGRPYKKNDNCFVEQKNYSIVRRAVGYARYDTEKELDILNRIYRHLRLYTNFFQPTMKLIEKTRHGSKVTKKYDKPQTPYQRILQSKDILSKNKKKLNNEYAKLNPEELKRKITKLQKELLTLVNKKT